MVLHPTHAAEFSTSKNYSFFWEAHSIVRQPFLFQLDSVSLQHSWTCPPSSLAESTPFTINCQIDPAVRGKEMKESEEVIPEDDFEEMRRNRIQKIGLPRSMNISSHSFLQELKADSISSDVVMWINPVAGR